MVNLKRISADGIDEALDKANHYRLLNEPMHAESICLDVLEVDPENQRALITLLLALTDQFPSNLHTAYQHAESLIPRLAEQYDRHYYEGIVNERRASAQLEQGIAERSVPELLGRAMRCYELAEQLSQSKNPDPILRWNTCARLNELIDVDSPEPPLLTRDIQAEFGDDVPPH